MWPRLAEISIAAWLAASPWVLGHGDRAALWVNDVGCGAAIAALALLSFVPRLRRLHLLELLVAAWLLGFGFLASPDPLPGLQNDILAALVLPMFAIVPNQANRPPHSWREPVDSSATLASRRPFGENRMNSASQRGEDGYLQAATQGTLAGLIATIPMTGVMKAMHRRLPFWQHYRLPPEQITSAMAQTVGIDDRLDRGGRRALTWASHFGYGALCGAAYGLLARRTRLPPVLGGAGFGLAVWAGSYLGWLPATGIRADAAREPAPRNNMMIAAHLVWGATASALYHAMASKK